jgi:hypothetical protein
MPKLTYSKRKKLPKKSFALIQIKTTKTGKKITKKRFPINDKARARNAIQQLPNGKNLTLAEKNIIKKKAEKNFTGHLTIKK